MQETSNTARRAVRASRVSQKDILSAVSCRSVDLQRTISHAVSASTTLRQFETATIRALQAYPGVVASIWNYVSQGRCRLGDLRLQGPAFDRDDVQSWLSEASVAATEDSTRSVVPCPMISNLAAILIPTARPCGDFDVLTILVTSQGAEQVLNAMHAGQLISRGLMLWHSSQDSALIREDLRTTAAVVDLCSRVSESTTIEQACMASVNYLKEYLECESVFVGITHRGRRRVVLTAVSGMSRVDRNSTTTRMMSALLNEAALRSEISVWPAESADTQHQLLAHQQLGRHLSAGSVSSVCCRGSHGELVAVISFVFGASSNAQEAASLVNALSAPLGATLSVVKRTRRSLPVRFWRFVFSENPVGRLFALVVFGAAVCVGMAVPVPYRVSSRFIVEAVQRQYSVAPFDGLLESALVQPGDTVTKGQLLAKMDDRELHWKLAANQAEAERATRESDVYLAERDIARADMSSLESSRLASEAKLIRHRLDSLEIRSPMDGVVLAGSVDRRENFPVQTGGMLFEIAPISRLRFEVAVPAEDCMHIKVGQTVSMRVDGQVDQELQGQIQRIRPRSEIVDSQNVFIAEVELNDTSQLALRPGMEGAARVVTQDRPLGWILFHRAWEYLIRNVAW